jgi:hypothetical protein
MGNLIRSFLQKGEKQFDKKKFLFIALRNCQASYNSRFFRNNDPKLMNTTIGDLEFGHWGLNLVKRNFNQTKM